MLVPVFDIGTYLTISMDDTATADEWSTASYVALGNFGLKVFGIIMYYLLGMRVNLAWIDVVGSLALGYFTMDADSV